jgi:hypothetical protein
MEEAFAQALGILIPPLTWQRALILAPCAVLLVHGHWSRRSTSDRAVMRSTVAWGCRAAAIVLALFTLYVFYAIAVSRHSTAVLGILAIPFTGTPLFLVTFVVGWSIAVIRARAIAGPRVSAAAVVSAVLTLTNLGSVFAANQHTRRLVLEIRETASPDRLRVLASSRWARWDTRVLEAIARHEKLPDDLIRELSHGPERVRSMLAGNARTPVDVLLAMSADTWSAAGVLVHSDDPAVTPDVLRSIATGPFRGSFSQALIDNPRTPPELADELRQRRRLRLY